MISLTQVAIRTPIYMIEIWKWTVTSAMILWGSRISPRETSNPTGLHTSTPNLISLRYIHIASMLVRGTPPPPAPTTGPPSQKVSSPMLVKRQRYLWGLTARSCPASTISPTCPVLTRNVPDWAAASKLFLSLPIQIYNSKTYIHRPSFAS